MTTRERRSDTAAMSISPEKNVRFVRSSFLAPKLCAVNVDIPDPRFMIGRRIIESTLYAVVIAATVAVPKPFMKFWRTRPPAELTVDCIMGGHPNFTPSIIAAFWKSGFANLSSSYFLLLYMTMKMVIAICEIIVAIAAPFTLIPRNTTAIISRITFETDDISTP